MVNSWLNHNLLRLGLLAICASVPCGLYSWSATRLTTESRQADESHSAQEERTPATPQDSVKQDSGKPQTNEQEGGNPRTGSRSSRRQSDESRRSQGTPDRSDQSRQSRGNRNAENERGRDQNSGNTNRSNPSNRSVTAEREAAALVFVKQHHPELSRLLTHLKKNRPGDYARAIRELFRKSEQLASIQDRGDNQRYNLELNIWKTDSRARLLAARLAHGENEELQERLRQVLKSHYNFKRRLMERDRERLAERLTKIDQNLANIESNFDDIVERELQVLMRQTQTALGDARNRRSNDNSTPADTDGTRDTQDSSRR